VREFHPGQVLANFMSERGLSTYKLATGLKVVHSTVFDIVNERRGITAEMAIRLAAFFRNEPEYWLELQNRFELNRARRKLQMQMQPQMQPQMLMQESDSNATVFDASCEREEKCLQESEECGDWKEQIRKSEFIREKGIEDVFRAYEMLGVEPVSFDALAYELKLNGGQLSAILVGLELSGWVKRLPGDYYVRSR